MGHNNRFAALAAFGLALGFASAAQAGPFLPGGDRTTQPVGHYDLCQRKPAECEQTTSKRAPVELTRALWAEIVDINNVINTMVTPRTDWQIWGVEERWSYPTDGIGDCEDYALEKRRRLMARGVPAGDLLMTVARQRNGDGHAVLTIRTSRGDFVLDNLEPRVLAWSDTEYTYLKRQSERNSGAWVAVDDSRSAVAVGSVK
jgi:predicted transglutaminase-like cysteine proteinase